MVAAGYAMYGSSTVLVISTGGDVRGFTLDPQLGEFILTHPKIVIPPRGNIYSVNEGNTTKWDPAMKEFVNNVKFPPKESGRKPYSLRYVGSMVADMHRTFLYGGVFCYPADSRCAAAVPSARACRCAHGRMCSPSRRTAGGSSPKGKLRVLYEVFPMAYLAEKAGGAASTGKGRCLEIQPQGYAAVQQGAPRAHGRRAVPRAHRIGRGGTGRAARHSIHERSPCFLGSKEDVADIEALYVKHGLKA